MKTFYICTQTQGRLQEGAIMAVTDGPPVGIGLQEGKLFIALCVSDEDAAAIGPIGLDQQTRYRIPLNRLPGLDLSRAKNPDDFYQPYIDAHPRTGMARQANLLFPVAQDIGDFGDAIHPANIEVEGEERSR